MDKKLLLKLALISSPIMAIFELSPVFFMNGNVQFDFWVGVVIVTAVTLALWSFNIYIFFAFEQKPASDQWKKYVFSYLFAFLAIAVFILFAQQIHAADSKDSSPVFPFVNATASNTIILIIINSVVNRSKKDHVARELANLKIKNLEAEQQQLIRQLQPHFLFNALSTLKSLINTNTEQAEEYLVKLADFLRFSISSHNKELVDLGEELKFTADYIKLQQIRFGESFQCKLSIPEDIRLTTQLPVYALQTLVENAIKHNVFTDAKPLRLSITFAEGYIEVRNNKMPKPNEVKSGVGLENLNKRFTLLGSEKIRIVDEPDFFLVSVKLIPKL